jgi:hypothetical protein
MEHSNGRAHLAQDHRVLLTRFEMRVDLLALLGRERTQGVSRG